MSIAKTNEMKKILIFTFMVLSTILANGQNPDFLKMVEYGIKAPSGHNTQPWKFRLNENSIDVYPNFSKELPVIDVNHRELYISLGCAVENICIASNEFGYSCQTEIIKQDSLSFIRIELQKSEVDKNPLFDQIDKRQTNRSVYKSKSIQTNAIDELKKLNIKKPVSIYFYPKGESDFSKLCEFIYRGNEMLFTDKDFKIELLDWMRFNSGHAQKERDGLAYNVIGSPSLPKWIGRPVVNSFLTPKTQNKTEKEKLNSSSHLVLIATQENTVDNWILAGIILERFFLKCTELGISVAFSNQPCEVNTLADEVRKQIAIDNNYPMLLMRIGYADPMPYSVRKELKDVIIE